MSQMRYVSTISGNENDIVAVRGNRVDVDLELGQIRDTGHTAYVRSTYAARYNFGVQQYNNYETEGSKKKRNMRGGRFFLFNIVIFIFFVGSTVCINLTSQNKLIGIPAVVVSVFYLIATCYNWHIHRTNGSLIHDNMIEVSGQSICGSVNKHFTIPIHARIQNREFLAASDGSTTAILARLQERYEHLTEIRVMLYVRAYTRRYASFPCETILHFILFLVMLLVTIIYLLNQATE